MPSPEGEGRSYDWNTTEMQWQLRNLAVLENAGAQVNLCMGPWTNHVLFEPGAERLAVDLVEHLVRERGCDHIRWLSLFNEPDHFYSTGSAEYPNRSPFASPFSCTEIGRKDLQEIP